MSRLTAVAAGGELFTVALDAEGTVWSWGYNGEGQLGDGSFSHRSQPVKVSGLRDVVAVAAGRMHSLAVKADGTVWSWGDNFGGQLGRSGTRSVPGQIEGFTNPVVAVAAGVGHSLALDAVGRVWAWGRNSEGQLGTGDLQHREVPVRLSGLSGITAIAARDYHSLALRSDGTVRAWGYNSFGQVGTGSYTWREPSPKQVINVSGAIGIASGRLNTSYALLSSGGVLAWGNGKHGDLGNGAFESTTATHTPVQVSNLGGVTAISDGPVALRDNGTLWAWGRNSDFQAGRLGDGSTTDRGTRRQVKNVQQSVPQTPADLDAVAGERLGYLHLEQPASVVTQYVTTPYLGGSPQPAVATGSGRAPYAVQGLDVGATYSFEVAAQNCLGQSGTSNRSSRIVPTDVQLGEKGFKIEGTELTDRLTLNVNAFNGNVALHAADLRVAGTGLDLLLSRTYNNLSSDAGSPWGARWSASVGAVRLEFLSGGSILFHAPGGGQLGFAKNDDGTYESPPGVNATLALDDGGTPQDPSDDRFHLTEDATYERLTFHPTSGKLLEARDKHGNAMTYAYGGPGGALTKITDTQGRKTTLTYNAQGRVEEVTDPALRTYAYTYDGSGNLVSYADPAGGETKLTYDTSGSLTSIITPAGRRLDLTYDASRRVASLRWPLVQGSPTTTFTYTQRPGGERETVVTDARNRKTTYDFDPVGNTTRVTDALRNATSLDYTSHSNVRRHTAAQGGTTSLGYTSVHALSAVQAPTGSEDTLAYDDARHPHLPTRITDPQGNEIKLVYDELGNVVSQENQRPSANRVELDYNPDGSIDAVTDPRGNATVFSYDADGNPTTTTPPSPLGAISLTYDAVSRVTSVTDGEGQTTSFGYDPLDRVTRIAYADDTEISYAYDLDGNLLEMTDRHGTVKMSYDRMGRLERVEEEGPETWKEVRYAYDGVGNLTEMRVTWWDLHPHSGCGLLGHRWCDLRVEYAYSSVNLPTRVEVTSGAWSSNTTEVSSFTYDADYNRTSVAYANGITQTFDYDPSGRVSRLAVLRDDQTLRRFTYSYDRSGDDTALRHSVVEERLDAYPERGAGSVPWTFGAGHQKDWQSDTRYFRVHHLGLTGTLVHDERQFAMDVFCEQDCLVGERQESEDVVATELCDGCTSEDKERWLGKDSGIITSAALGMGLLSLNASTVVDTQTGEAGTIMLTGSDNEGIGTYTVLRSVEDWASAWTATVTVDAEICFGAWPNRSCSSGPVTFTILAVSAAHGSGSYVQVDGAGEPVGARATRPSVRTASYDYDVLNHLVGATTEVFYDTTSPEGRTPDLTIEDAFTYDGAGNRVERVRDAERSDHLRVMRTEEASFNPADELTELRTRLATDPGQAVETTREIFTYDKNGNLIGTSHGAAHTYNASGQTTSITPRAGRGHPVAFTYRGAGQTERASMTLLEAPAPLENTSATPPARSSHAMAYDAARQEVVLFGGIDPDGGLLPDTWVWDGETWTQRDPATRPPPLSGHAMAYDAARDEVVLFGGSGGGLHDHTWVWDGETWTQRNPTTRPPPLSGHAMAYDASRQEVVLFGGDGGGLHDDTWVWDGETWAQRNPTTRPPPLSRHAMAYDATRDEIVVALGYDGWLWGGTWAWDGETWTEKSPSSSPAGRYDHATAYDASRDEIVLFGGYNGKKDTWAWDGETWTEKSPLTSPPGRLGHAVAYDASRDEIVLFGGTRSSGRLSDTWVWDGSRWVSTADETEEYVATANQAARGLTETAFLYTSTGLTAQESPWSPHEEPHTRKTFLRDPAGTLLMQVTADLTREPMLGLGEIEDVEHQRHYYLLDGVGSVIGLADEDGEIVASWTYDPFGEVTEEYGDTHLTPFGFTSAYQDPTGLLKMGERYYDPTLGRFTQQDPIWDPLDPKAWNRYVYVGNDPINFVDPTGLSAWDWAKCVGRDIAGGIAEAWQAAKGHLDTITDLAWAGAGLGIGIGGGALLTLKAAAAGGAAVLMATGLLIAGLVLGAYALDRAMDRCSRR